MKRTWFLYFIRKAISERAGRFGLSLFAVMLLASVLTAYLLITLGIKEALGRELKRFGANMIVLPRKGHIPESALNRLRAYPHVRAAGPQIYGTITVEGQPVNLIGLSVKEFLAGRLKGRPPEKEQEVMVGASLAQALSLEEGSEVSVGDGTTLRVVGIFERGTEEDLAIVTSLETAKRLLGTEGYSAILVNVEPEALEDVAKKVSTELSLKTKTVMQIARAEQSLYEKIKLLMLMVMVVVTVCVSASLSSTMGANILERMEEIGLMKALGARRAQIDLHFLAEAALAGILGSIAGFLAGVGVAEAVARTAFGAFVPVKILVLVPVALFCILIVLASTVVPVRRATGVPASWILRGE
jgi:putative ABC transport system permease protein